MNRRLLARSILSLSCVLVPARAFADSPPTVTATTPSGGQVAAVGCTSMSVSADGTVPCATPPPPPAPSSRKRWYGWQTLLTDGAALALAMGATNDNSAAGWASLGAYVLGGPIVHAAHGSPGKMGASLALRVGAPLLFGFGGYALARGFDKGSESWGPVIVGLLGAAVGTAGAVAVDASVLARETVDPPRAPRPPREEARAHTIELSPTVSPARGGAAVGALGTF